MIRPAAIGDPRLAACPLAPTQIYYFNNYHNKVKQLAFFGELTYAPDRQMVGDRRRSLVPSTTASSSTSTTCRSVCRLRAIPTPTDC